MTVEKYLSVAETTEYLGTSERFVRRLIAERRIAFHHVGRHVRVALSDLDLWLASGRVEAIDLDEFGGVWVGWRDGEQEGASAVRQRP